MNRTSVGVAAVLILTALGLITFPLWFLGQEQFDPEQEVGILFLPFGLVLMLVALTTIDPRVTTVGGAWGNPEFDPPLAPGAPARPVREPLPFDPREAVNCRQCRTVIAPELARCPRCGLARICRRCDRPLGLVLERPTCPSCAQAEIRCSCPPLPKGGARPPVRRRSWGRA